MKFTQQQLEEAYQQMQDERQAESATAYKAAEWLKQNLGIGMSRCNCHVSNRSHYNWSAISPFPSEYSLILVYETYGPHLNDYFDVLDNLPFITKNDGDVYEAATPFGKYKIEFEYFDNHCTGY
jgi:hypothetical protein